MEIKSEQFEQKKVTDISARYDNSTVDFTLQEGDSFTEQPDYLHVVFANPNGLKSEMRLFKKELRAISYHQRLQRYKIDLPATIATGESTSLQDSMASPSTGSSGSSSLTPEPQA